MNAYLQPLSRFFLALLFIFTGFTKIPGFEGMSAMMGGIGFPAPALFLTGAILVELVGGLALLLGYKTRPVSVLLILFLLPTTVIFHAMHIDGTQAGQMEAIATLKNLAIIGGLLMLVANGAGAYSLDGMKLREANASPVV